MNHFLKKTQRLIFFQQGSIFSSALLISMMIIISRLFGFLRYRILAGFFNKEELDIFFASFRIPDLIFEILITGALSTAFIPLIIKYQKDKEKLSRNISSIINFIGLIMLFLIILISVSIKYLIPLITPGYSMEKNRQIIFFSRLLLITQLPFMIIGNLLIGFAQAYKVFILTSIAPVLYNITIIIFTIFFAKKLYLFGPILGVIIGSIIFCFSQLPIIFKINFFYQPIIEKTEGLVSFLKIIVPRVLTVITAQVDATVDLILTTFLGSGRYTIFYLAQHLQLLPVSVIGMAIGQASLPYLTETYQQGKIEEFRKIIINSVLNIFFLTVPVASFFIFARTPLTRLFFGGEKFDWEATVLTAYTLSCFSLSLPFHSLYYFLTRCFYAALDSKTPFYISIFSIFINTLLSLFFVFFFKLPVWSLALSFSFSMSLNIIFMLAALTKNVVQLDFKSMFLESFKIIGAAFFTSFFSYQSMKILDTLILDTTRTINIFFLLLIVGSIFSLLYLFLSWIFNVREISVIVHLLIKAKEYKRKIIEIYNQYD
jgi:putative peptidoglycan lipid II flippase